MAGAIPGDVVMHARPIGRGYVQFQETAAMPWGHPAASPVRAHEFHHSSLDNLPADSRFAYEVQRGHGIDGRHDGVVVHKLLASYAHRRQVGSDHWAARFVDYVRRETAPQTAANLTPSVTRAAA
jgi:cobyrinic acid a,c-diamide synthase